VPALYFKWSGREAERWGFGPEGWWSHAKHNTAWPLQQQDISSHRPLIWDQV